jgi:hypothetical protein
LEFDSAKKPHQAGPVEGFDDVMIEAGLRGAVAAIETAALVAEEDAVR